jgi:uncharacterized protein YbjT (DUF2867 family)
MKVMMVGATGPNAGLVLPALTAAGVTVRALVRDTSRAEVARQRGAEEIAIGDLRDARSLRAAAEGVDGVFHISPAFAPGEVEMGQTMIAAAKDAGVEKLVFSSVFHPTIGAMVNHAAKQPVEEALYTSGMDFTVLQPAMFMQNLTGAVGAARESGQFAMPYSKHAKVSWVDYRDVAEAAALAFTTSELSRGTFELCSRGLVDRVEMAAMLSRAVGRPVEATEVPRDRWSAQLPGGPLRDGLTRMMAHYDTYGFPGGNALVLRAVLGREPRTLEQFFHEVAAR